MTLEEQDHLSQVTQAIERALELLDEVLVPKEAFEERRQVKAALERAQRQLEVAKQAREKLLGSELFSDEEPPKPVSLELDQLAGLQHRLQDVSFSGGDGARLTSHLDALNGLLDVSANALGAATVDDLLRRVVEGACQVTGARLAMAESGYRSGVLCRRAFSTAGAVDGSSASVPQELIQELLEQSPLVRRPLDWGRVGGELVGVRLVGREGNADGFLMVFERAEGGFNAEDEALLSQLAVFTSLGLQHIQARSEAEARFAEAERGHSILQALMNYAPEGITVADAPDATIQMISRVGRQMVSRSPGEAEGTSAEEPPRHWRIFRSADGQTATTPELPLIRAIRNGETIIDEEWLLENDAGRRTPALFNAGPIRDRQGEVTGGIAVFRDITTRKRAEAELLAARERLIRQEKLAFLGALAGGVGHELRTPLGSIKNAAYFLKMVVEAPGPEVNEALDILEREVGTVERIITALLDFARPRPPDRRPVDLNALLRETLEKVERNDEIEVRFRLEPEVIVSADPGQLGQVFGNIIVNAVQAITDSGQLTISSSKDDQEVTISIADTGRGIESGHLEELFEPLFTTKARGIGLGLSVAQTLVRRHDGTIEVQSELGRGSVFTVRLPRAAPEGGE